MMVMNLNLHHRRTTSLSFCLLSLFLSLSSSALFLSLSFRSNQSKVQQNVSKLTNIVKRRQNLQNGTLNIHTRTGQRREREKDEKGYSLIRCT